MRRYIRARRGRFIAVMALLVVSTVLLLGGNFITQMLIDAVMAQDVPGVKRYIVASIGYGLFSTAVYVASSVSQYVFGAVLINDMRVSVFSGILRRSRADFMANHTADYVSALTNDLHAIGAQINMFCMVVLSTVGMVTATAIMLCYQPIVAVCTVLSALMMTAAPSLLGRVMAKWQKRRSERLAALTAMLSECFAGFETIVTFGIQRQIRRRFEACSGALRDCECRADGVSALSAGLSQVLSVLAQTMMLALICYMVLTGRMSVGAMMVFTSLNTTFCSNLTMVLQGVPMLRGIQPVMARVNGYADYRARDDEEQAVPSFREAVRVENLRFGYEDGCDIVTDLSLTLRRGGKYALTGESGCGKSTLIRLLLGDYPDYEGSIRYDGTELRQLRRDRLNQVAACIHQDVFLFDDTIYNNICLFEEFSEEQFARVIRASGVDRFMDGFPEGASYAVGERGERLSGGQRQRIAIARALIRDTAFLILDEGTSALDERTAGEIENELLGMRGLTLLTVTHHLKNPQAYDAVFEMRDGMAVAAG